MSAWKSCATSSNNIAERYKVAFPRNSFLGLASAERSGSRKVKLNRGGSAPKGWKPLFCFTADQATGGRWGVGACPRCAKRTKPVEYVRRALIAYSPLSLYALSHMLGQKLPCEVDSNR